MKQLILYAYHWIISNPDKAIDTALMLWGFLIARGYIRAKWLQQLYADAVAFAEQWRKNYEKENGSPAHPVAVKEKAVGYLAERGVSADGQLLEAHVHRLGKKESTALRDDKGRFCKT